MLPLNSTPRRLAVERRDHSRANWGIRMPTSDDEYRSMSLPYGGVYIPFTQPESHCSGWAAMWLRAALNGKIKNDFWWRNMTDETFFKNHVSGGTIHMEPTGKAKEKAKTLHALSFDDEETYLKSGSRQGKGPKETKAKAEVISAYRQRYIGSPTESSDPLLKKIENLAEMLEGASTCKCLLRFSINLCDGQYSHAVAADFMNVPPRVRYFDPLLGDFLFPTFKHLLGWWGKCYRQRDNTRRDGAFDHFDNSFHGKLYERVVSRAVTIGDKETFGDDGP